MKNYERKINYYETDQMGIVHHSNYARFFEEARLAYMEELGYPYERMEEEGIICPVMAISCKFMHSVKFGDTIRIAVHPTSVSKVKCAFAYEVIDAETGELKAKGSSEHGFINREGKPVVLSKEKPEFFRMLSDELEQEQEL